MEQGTVAKVAGPLVVATGLPTSKMFDVVRVGAEGLMGEIIEMRGDRASIQVYEETEGIGPGDPVIPTGAPLSVELGPGMLGNVYDGVQRPLDALMLQTGSFLARGVSAPGLPRDVRWEFEPVVSPGDAVRGGYRQYASRTYVECVDIASGADIDRDIDCRVNRYENGLRSQHGPPLVDKL